MGNNMKLVCSFLSLSTENKAPWKRLWLTLRGCLCLEAPGIWYHWYCRKPIDLVYIIGAYALYTYVCVCVCVAITIYRSVHIMGKTETLDTCMYVCMYSCFNVNPALAPANRLCLVAFMFGLPWPHMAWGLLKFSATAWYIVLVSLLD